MALIGLFRARIRRDYDFLLGFLHLDQITFHFLAEKSDASTLIDFDQNEGKQDSSVPSRCL